MAHRRIIDRTRPASQPVFEQDNLSVVVWVTVTTSKKKPVLASADIHSLLLEAWAQADHWLVGRYVILPDHLHLFCSPGRHDALPVRNWIRFWKSRASAHWPRPGEHPIWTPQAWDRQLRTGESYSGKWDYVRGNPVRHGLVDRAEMWPWQGELHELIWHDR